MTTEQFQVAALIPASPNRIYAAWMDERRHSAFTGGRATVDPWIGGRVTALDGYVDATHILLETGRRVVLTWRTADFPIDAPDSRVEILLEPAAGGTQVIITHSEIPEGQSSEYRKRWRTHYLDGMKKFFGKPTAAKAAMKAAKQAGHLPISGIARARLGYRRPITAARPVVPTPAPTPPAAPKKAAGAPARPAPKAPTAGKGAKSAALAKAKAATAAKAALRAGAPATPGAKKAASAAKPAPTKPGAKKALPAAQAAPQKSAPAKAVSSKPAPKKAAPARPASSKPAPKKAAPAAKKAVPKKAAPAAKKAAPKKTAPKKAPAKKVPAKKAAPKKAPAKKAPAKKAAPKKAPAKKRPR